MINVYVLRNNQYVFEMQMFSENWKIWQRFSFQNLDYQINDVLFYSMTTTLHKGEYVRQTVEVILICLRFYPSFFYTAEKMTEFLYFLCPKKVVFITSFCQD